MSFWNKLFHRRKYSNAEELLAKCRGLVDVEVMGTTVIFTNSKTYVASYDLRSKIIKVSLYDVESNEHLMFSILHEFRHAYQHKRGYIEGKFNEDGCLTHIICEDTYFEKFSQNQLSMREYNELPWEIDANAFAAEIVGMVPQYLKNINADLRKRF